MRLPACWHISHPLNMHRSAADKTVLYENISNYTLRVLSCHSTRQNCMHCVLQAFVCYKPWFGAGVSMALWLHADM